MLQFLNSFAAFRFLTLILVMILALSLDLGRTNFAFGRLTVSMSSGTFIIMIILLVMLSPYILKMIRYLDDAFFFMKNIVFQLLRILGTIVLKMLSKLFLVVKFFNRKAVEKADKTPAYQSRRSKSPRI